MLLHKTLTDNVRPVVQSAPIHSAPKGLRVLAEISGIESFLSYPGGRPSQLTEVTAKSDALSSVSSNPESKRIVLTSLFGVDARCSAEIRSSSVLAYSSRMVERTLFLPTIYYSGSGQSFCIDRTHLIPWPRKIPAPVQDLRLSLKVLKNCETGEIGVKIIL